MLKKGAISSLTVDELSRNGNVCSMYIINAVSNNMGKSRMTATQQKRAFLESYVKCGGNIQATCKTIGISPDTYGYWRKNDDDFRQRVEELKFVPKVYVIGKLFEKIEQGDTTAIIFYLKTQCADMGFSERISIDTGQTERQREIEELARKFYSEE